MECCRYIFKGRNTCKTTNTKEPYVIETHTLCKLNWGYYSESLFTDDSWVFF
jgi:hypothetical protein